VPTIELEVICSSFVPALVPTEVTFVEQPVISNMEEHRFRATDDCGFDAIISLPLTSFDADDAPYEMTTWWAQGSVPLGLLAVILRRSGDRTPLLAVATEGNLDLLNSLLEPLSVSMIGPECGTSSGVVYPVLLRDESPLPCEPESMGQLCHDGDVGYRVVGLAAPDSTDAALVMGRADLLSWILQ
jgi:hypothetical protein